MDPDQTLRDLFENLHHLYMDLSNQEARAEAINNLRSLTEWLERDGFAPFISQHVRDELEKSGDQFDERV